MRATLSALMLSATVAVGGPAAAEALLEPTARDAVRAELLFLPEDEAQLGSGAPESALRLTITGAYSSGDRFAPEGFVIRRGDATHPWPQGWDGLLLIDGEGRLSLHDVSSVRVDGRVFDLRDRGARERFLGLAERRGFSAIQSHLLINDGALDLQPVEGAKKYRRRILFETESGEIGVWDSSPRMLTLYDAADALQQQYSPRFAFNLDMGTYDYCERQPAGGEGELCGVLARDNLSKLTNLLTLTVFPE